MAGDGGEAPPRLPRYRSDHNPIILTCGARRRNELRRTKLFRFEEIWLQEGDTCAEIVAKNWSRQDTNIMDRMASVGQALGS